MNFPELNIITTEEQIESMEKNREEWIAHVGQEKYDQLLKALVDWRDSAERKARKEPDAVL